jgi:hypothetical protein
MTFVTYQKEPTCLALCAPCSTRPRYLAHAGFREAGAAHIACHIGSLGASRSLSRERIAANVCLAHGEVNVSCSLWCATLGGHPPVQSSFRSRFAAQNRDLYGRRSAGITDESVLQLRDSRRYTLSAWKSSQAFEAISDPSKLGVPTTVVGHSELLAGTGRRKGK